RVCLHGLDGLQDLFLLKVEAGGDLLDGGRTTKPLPHIAHGPADAKAGLLEAPGDPNGPALVPEMPFELPDDRDRRVRRELNLTPGIEAVDRVQQADHGHL